MMKKTVFSVAVAAALLFGAREAKAQTPYQSAAGLAFFGGRGGMDVAIQYKTALERQTAIQAQAAFGNDWIALGGDYLYQKAISEADDLSWYAGGGVQLNFWTSSGYNSSMIIGLRPQIGLEYKLPTIPVAVHLDYKPYIGLNSGVGVDGGGFTFGVKYILK